MSGWRGSDKWQDTLMGVAARLANSFPSPRLVAAAYADWARAGSPRPEEVCRFACSINCGAMLLDTWSKDGTTLLDWLSPLDISRLVKLCRHNSIPVALAGSLGLEEIRVLAPIDPDWFAVRGAVCRRGERTDSICEERVRTLAKLVGEPTSARATMA
jgi:uncharacterized protein (UPF0264 family)